MPRVLPLVACLVLSAVQPRAAFAEQPAASRPGAVAAGLVPSFGSGVDLVQLDLVVRDRKGAVIRDLRADEVEVFEDGVRQQTAEFRFVDVRLAATPAAPPAVQPALGEPARAGAAAGAGPEQRRVNLIAIVFDQLSVAGRPLALQAVRAFLLGQAPADAFVALFRIDGRLKLAHNFSRDRDSLLAALEAASFGNAPAFASGVAGMGAPLSASTNAGDPRQRGFDARELRPAHFAGDAEAGSPMDGDGPLTAERNIANATLDILRTAEEAERTQRGHRSLDGLGSVVHGLRGMRGRKTLLYVSEGLQVPPWLEQPFRALVSEANRASVSIYGLDVRGLGASGPSDDARALLEQAVHISQSQRLSGGNWRGVTREQAREFDAVETTLRMNSQATLDDLARGTGGFLIAESNDLKRGLQRLAEDVAAYYEVAYVPVDRRLDGRFRHVSVRPRRSGARVQAREGYFAVPHRAGEPVRAFEAPLLEALASKRPPRSFAHEAGVFRFESDGRLVQHALVVAVPLHDASFRRDERAGHYLGRISVLAVVRSESGDIVEKVGQDYLVEGPLADLEATRDRRLSFSRRVGLPPGTYVVDVAVRDALGERTGCSRRRLVVAPAPTGLALSSVVALAGAQPASGEDGDDPFRLGDARMAPDLSGGLRVAPRSGAALALYCVVYSQPGAHERPRLTLEIDRAGRVIRRGSIPLPAADASGRIPHVTQVPTSTLPAGEYTLRLSASQDGFTVMEEARLSIASR